MRPDLAPLRARLPALKAYAAPEFDVTIRLDGKFIVLDPTDAAEPFRKAGSESTIRKFIREHRKQA